VLLLCLQAVACTGLFVAFCSIYDPKAAGLYLLLLNLLMSVCVFNGVMLLKTLLAKAAASYVYKSRCLNSSEISVKLKQF
jgi:hypothetical protein